MGIARSCFGQPSPERLPEEPSNLRESNDAASGLTSSIMQFMKVSCLGTRNEAKNASSGPKEKKEVTLGECLLSSPIQGNVYNANGDDQFYVLRPSPFSRVHPAYINPSIHHSTERLLPSNGCSDYKVVDGSQSDFCSLSRSRSGINKKRVSFKLPEEADIFVYNVPDDDIDGE